MHRRRFLVVSASMATIAALGRAATSPKSRPEAASGISAEERVRTLELMRPPKRSRPIIAVLAEHRGTETTDFIVPWSILKTSGIADVVAVSTKVGIVRLMPALNVELDQSTGDFDRLYPEGADYIIVPAFHNPKSDLVISWIRKQAALGATIIGICSGALVLAHAGLLENKRVTTHWYDQRRLQLITLAVKIERDRRYVADA